MKNLFSLLSEKSKRPGTPYRAVNYNIGHDCIFAITLPTANELGSPTMPRVLGIYPTHAWAWMVKCAPTPKLLFALHSGGIVWTYKIADDGRLTHRADLTYMVPDDPEGIAVSNSGENLYFSCRTGAIYT